MSKLFPSPDPPAAPAPIPGRAVTGPTHKDVGVSYTVAFPDERTVADRWAALRPLLNEVRAGLAPVFAAPGPACAGRFLAHAPLDACVRLADAWAAVAADGPALGEGFALDDQLLLEMVTAVYGDPGALPPSVGRRLDRLVEEMIAGPDAAAG